MKIQDLKYAAAVLALRNSRLVSQKGVISATGLPQSFH
jgi:hypothetical protein